MKRKLIIILISSLAIVVCSKCYYDKADLVYPVQASGCDTSNVKLSVEINAVLEARCFSCHSGNAQSGGGIKLQNYTVLKAYARNGQLLSSIKQDGTVSPMPKGGGKLPNCEINQFKAWINNGNPNN